MFRLASRWVFIVASLLAISSWAFSREDSYLAYLKNAPEFKPVAQDPQMMIGRWSTWVYMPWRYQWDIGTSDAGGQFCRDHGINGGVSDHGRGPLEWLDKWHLKFYNDHTAAKGFLHLRGAPQEKNFRKYFGDPRAIRSGTDGPQPLDEALLEKLKAIITQRINGLKTSPNRVAYALDDEISSGVFVLPICWRVNGDDQAYETWLSAYYGGNPPKPLYVTPDFVLKQLGRPLKELDFSPLLDRLTYNDSVWSNFIGQLVEHANRIDPDTPCGFVGAQEPSIWGGYDYAKIARKIQFIEAYDIGSAQAILRSFNPENAIPAVTTHLHVDQNGVSADTWQSWYYFAHGNRGMIGWVEGWFEKGKPKSWLTEYAPTLKELGEVQGPKVVGARWIHDGVAVYYSHPSIQVSYCLDIEGHGSTWINRRGDHKRGTSHTVRKAWENILNDAGIQYNFVSYNEVAVSGIPSAYKVLILPACYALSDIEAARIKDFARNGGTVIADFACGIFDHHGKGRTSGVLDSLFGVKHTGEITKKDFFGGRLWTETNQDEPYNFKTFRHFLDASPCKLDSGFAIAERKLPIGTVAKAGNGRAVYLNLSPLRYLQYREEGTADDAKREPFIKHILAGGVKPWVKITTAGKRPRNVEVTYWSKGGRTIVFIVQNVPLVGDDDGGGHGRGFVKEKMRIDIEFSGPVKGAIDERTGKELGDGQKFTVDYNSAEAALLSFSGAPPRL